MRNCFFLVKAVSVSFPLLALGGACSPTQPIQKPPQQPSGPAATAQAKAPAPSIPPVVITGEVELVCNISSSENGSQKLIVRKGSGLEFDVVVSPIVDGVVNTKGPDKGGSYRFSSHLAEPATGVLAGVGDVTIDQLETRVNVAVDQYQQPGGPGTALSFTSTDMGMRGIYIEFAGRASGPDGKRYAFRVNLGGATGGSGKVTPTDANDSSPIVAKSVMVEAPATTVVATTTIQQLP